MADNQSNANTKPRQGNRRPNNNNRNNNNNNRRKPRRNNYRRPKQKPLTLWQKILKFFGLYDPKKANKSQNNTQTKDSNKKPQKDRVAKEKNFKPKSSEEIATTRLYVGNLSYEATEFELEDLFKGIGNVKSVEVIYNKHTHRSKGYAFISMGTIDDAKRAIEVLHNQPFMGRNLNISGAKERPEGDNNSND